MLEAAVVPSPAMRPPRMEQIEEVAPRMVGSVIEYSIASAGPAKQLHATVGSANAATDSANESVVV